MPFKPGSLYYKEFVTSSPSTGAATNADSLPTATANHNGSDDGAFTLTVANQDTGRYKISGTVPSGYAHGDVVCCSVAATVGGVAGKAIVDTFQIDMGFDAVVIESGVNARQALSPILAAVTSILTVPAGAGSVVGKNAAGTTRFTTAVDGVGNRTGVVYNLPE